MDLLLLYKFRTLFVIYLLKKLRISICNQLIYTTDGIAIFLTYQQFNEHFISGCLRRHGLGVEVSLSI